jgi:hypothetical protein
LLKNGEFSSSSVPIAVGANCKIPVAGSITVLTWVNVVTHSPFGKGATLTIGVGNRAIAPDCSNNATDTSFVARLPLVINQITRNEG